MATLADDVICTIADVIAIVVRGRDLDICTRTTLGVDKKQKGNPNVHDVPGSGPSSTKWIRSVVGTGDGGVHASDAVLASGGRGCSLTQRGCGQSSWTVMLCYVGGAGKPELPPTSYNVSGRCAAPSHHTPHMWRLRRTGVCSLAGRCGSVACPPGRDRNGELRASRLLTRWLVPAPAQVSGWSFYGEPTSTSMCSWPLPVVLQL